MTQPSDKKPSDSTSSQENIHDVEDTAIINNLDPAEKDARWLRRWYPLSFVTKLAVFILLILLLVLLTIYYAIGTEAGTRYLLNAIAQQTGIRLNSGQGNLRDGLWIYDVHVPANPPNQFFEISLDKAYIKIGWRAILTKQLHLRTIHVDNLYIYNHEQAKDEPFSYEKISIPVALHLENITAKSVRYQQKGTEPLVFTQGNVKNFSWVNSQIKVNHGQVNFDKYLNINNLSGKIDLQNDYPLNATANLTIKPLTAIHFDSLQTQATGSLKHLVAKVKSRYNQSQIEGYLTGQPLATGVPFHANITWQDILLPYATEQKIHLKQGTLVANGVLDDITLRLNTQLSAKDIPNGHYQGRGRTNGNKLDIEHLSLKLSKGTLQTQGVLDWEKRFTASLTGEMQDIPVRDFLPKDVAVYAPETLNGKLSMVFKQAENKQPMEIKADLYQQDGETINAHILQENGKNQPVIVQTTWQNFVRQNVPDIGSINSPSGQANITIQPVGKQQHITVDTKADILKLHEAPQGNYQVKLKYHGQNIDIHHLDYQGVLGDLTGNGHIQLAYNNHPLTWKIDAKTQTLKLKALSQDIPVNTLSGMLKAHGSMQNIRQSQGNRSTRHIMNITQIDMTAEMPENQHQTSQKLAIVGSGNGSFDILTNQLTNFSAKFSGDLTAPILSNSQIKVDISGTPQLINVHHLNYQGGLGDLVGNAQLQLSQDGQPIAWKIDANTNTLKLKEFSEELPVHALSGRLKAQGSIQNTQQSNNQNLAQHIVTIENINMLAEIPDNKQKTNQKLNISGAGNGKVNLLANELKNFSANFIGSLTAPMLPSGKLNIDVAGTPQSINVHHFRHQSEVGGIDAKGNIDLQNGIKWFVSANMNHFNAGYFLPNLPSDVTGNVVSDGYWQDNEQYINIQQVNLNGKLKNKPILAKGKVNAKLNLPKDLTDLKQIFNSNHQQQVQQIRRLVHHIDIDDLQMQWENNQFKASGNHNQLIANVDISSLNQLIPQLKGSFKGDLVASQNNQQVFPNLYVDLVGKDINLPSLSIKNAILKGKIVDLAKTPSQLQLNLSDIKISDQPIRSIMVDFDGTQQNHWLNAKIVNEQGQLQASLTGSLDLKHQQWQGVLGNGQISTKYAQLKQLQPAEMRLNWQNPKIQLASHCWQMSGETAKLCLKENFIASATEGQINASVQQIDSRIFAMFIPADIVWEGAINGNALISWKKNQQPNINVSVYSDNGLIGMTEQSPEEPPITIAYDRVSIITRSTKKGLKLRADVKTAKGTGNGYFDAVIDPFKAEKPINGTIVFQDINLSILKPFLPSFQRLSGNAVMAGKIGGTLMQPNFVGDIEVENGAVAIIGVPLKLNNINILTHVAGNQANIEGSFKSAGQGIGEIKGTIDWTKQLQAKVKIQGENLQVNQPPLIFAEVNPLLEVIVKPQQKYVNIEGVVDVPKATIRPPEATKDVVNKSSDVNVIDRRLAGQIDEVLKVVQPWSINTDVAIDIGKNVNFKGFGASLPLAGALSITQREQGVMKGQGVVQVAKRSKVDIFGQNLNINYAQLRFNNVLTNPQLNIEAIKEIQGVTVGVRVKGDTENPNITVFNSGGLSDQQAMNALIMGNLQNNSGQNTSEEDFKTKVNNTLAAAGLSFGLSSTRGLTNEIGKAFGLEGLTLDASGLGDDTEVNITGYITPDLYIRYGVGVFNATNTLSMRYQLTRRFYVEAKSAINNSIDLVYNWRF